MSFFEELKRRNIIRVGTAYLVVAWLTLQVTDIVAPILDLPGVFSRNVLLILVIGFPLVLILAWLFELTPEGVKREIDVDRSVAISTRSTRKFDAGIIAVLAVAVTLFALDKFVWDQGLSTNAARQSIAVLPFVNMSSDAEQEYFSDGLTEELLNLLARMPELSVTSRSSAFYYKGKEIKIADVGRELGVAHILEGSVRRSGETIRVTAQLIQVETDTHLWSSTWDRKLEDIFVIQDEISQAVVRELKVRLVGDAPRSDTTDPEAYRLYLQAMHIISSLVGSKNQDAEALLRRVIELDQNYAPAWRELARILGRQIGTSASTSEQIKEVRETLIRALELNPGDAGAIAYQAWGYANYDGDFEAAARRFEDAIALDPGNEHVLRSMAIFASSFAKPAVAIKINKYAVEQNPVCYACYIQLYRTLSNAGQYEEAIALTLTMEALFHEEPDRTGFALLGMNDPDAALASFENSANEAVRLYGSTFAYHDLSRQDEFDASFAELQARPNDVSKIQIAAIHAYTGNVDLAIDVLEEFLMRYKLPPGSATSNWNFIQIAGFAKNSLFHNLRGNPRWERLLAEYGVEADIAERLDFDPALPDLG